MPFLSPGELPNAETEPRSLASSALAGIFFTTEPLKEAENIIGNARLDESQAGIKIAVRNINNLRYTDDTTLMAESEEELKSLSLRVKEESEKAGLQLNILKPKIISTSWQIKGEKVETVTDFLSWTPKSLLTVTTAMD